MAAKTGETVEADIEQMQAFAAELHIGTQALPAVAKIESLHRLEGKKREIGKRSATRIPKDLKAEALRQIGQDVGMVDSAKLLQNNDIWSSVGDNIQNPVRIDLTVTAAAVLECCRS